MFLAFSVMFTLICAKVFAQAEIGGFEIPEGDVMALFTSLFSNWKTLGSVGVSATVTLITVQGIKKFVDDTWKYKRTLTLVVAIVYAILASLISGEFTLAHVAVMVFFNRNGAMAIYNELKGLGIIKNKKKSDITLN